MGNVAVIYKSKYGTAKQYAKWIAEETGGTLFPISKVRLSDLKDFDTIVAGGGLYAGGILGFNFIKKNFAKLSGKKLIIFSVGASVDTDKTREDVLARNATPEMREKITYFHLRGGLDYPGMKWLDRTLMKMMIGILKKQPEDQRNDDTKAMIEMYGKKVSFLDRGSIAPLVAAVRG
jgi:menaquinone-dependent protoporphyrinogen IX oxidase